MGEMLERALAEQRLPGAWASVRDAALADGEGGPEIDRFEAAAARHISELPKCARRRNLPAPSRGLGGNRQT